MNKLYIKMTKRQMEQLKPAFDTVNKEWEKNPMKRSVILMQPFERGEFQVGVLPHFYAQQVYKIIERANKRRLK